MKRNRCANKTQEQRFFAKVDKNGPNGCWIWTGCISGGYGRFNYRLDLPPTALGAEHGRTIIASRASYIIHKGPIPPGMLVLHHCDNPPCVNPDHLYVGTDFDNSRDREVRGRVARGMMFPHAILTENDVREIRVLLAEGKLSRPQIGLRYGVSGSAIHNIYRRKNHKHVI